MLNILLIEDNLGDAVLIEELLKDVNSMTFEYTIRHVERTSQAIEILSNSNTIDVILSDITLPDSRGTETLDLLTEAASELPILFMTGTNDEALAKQALKQGAQDYLVKGQATGEMLFRSLEYAIERKNSLNEMAKIKAREIANLERIKALANEKEQLLALNRTKDEFVSLASHQLRTPSTAVKQYLGMIIEGLIINEVDPTVLQLVKSANESNERQIAVIEELLKTAQLDSTKISLDIERTNITALIREVITNQMPLVLARKQKINFTTEDEFELAIDKNEIRLVMENLIENASKYSPEGKRIDITMSVKQGFLLIEVIDQGVGIKKSDQKKIFEKFTRIDNELSDTVSGTGLGLYWAKRIVRLHKGTVRVQSQLGKGTMFTVSLPI